MKIECLNNTRTVRITAESSGDNFKIGRLSALIKNASVCRSDMQTELKQISIEFNDLLEFLLK